MAGNAKLWKPITGTKIVFKSLAELIPPVYEAIVANNIPGETVVVASTLALGARVAQDKFQIPTASVHLQPATFRSMIKTRHHARHALRPARAAMDASDSVEGDRQTSLSIRWPGRD